MNGEKIDKNRLFWPWQDEQEEAWLENMSESGWHLESVKLPCRYTFVKGEPQRYIYRMDYFYSAPSKLQDYMQIFRDAGWEYLGELSSWRYWRKDAASSGAAEIFTDRESKLAKYWRLLAFLGFFLVFLIYMAMILASRVFLSDRQPPDWAQTIYVIALALYAVIIPLYIVAVAQILRRIRQIKKKAL